MSAAARCHGNKTKWPPDNMQMTQVDIKCCARTTCLINEIKTSYRYLSSVKSFSSKSSQYTGNHFCNFVGRGQGRAGRGGGGL